MVCFDGHILSGDGHLEGVVEVEVVVEHLLRGLNGLIVVVVREAAGVDVLRERQVDVPHAQVLQVRGRLRKLLLHHAHLLLLLLSVGGRVHIFL